MQTRNLRSQAQMQKKQDDSRFGIVPERSKSTELGEVEGLLRRVYVRVNKLSQISMTRRSDCLSQYIA